MQQLRPHRSSFSWSLVVFGMQTMEACNILTLEELNLTLIKNNAHFEIIKQSAPILSTNDAKQYYDLNFAAPVFVVQTNIGLMQLIVRATRGKLDFKNLGTKLGLSKLKLADRKKVETATGYPIGSIPLIGMDLPCIFDNRLLCCDFIYGGSGDALFTLKIDPKDLMRINPVKLTFD